MVENIENSVKYAFLKVKEDINLLKEGLVENNQKMDLQGTKIKELTNLLEDMTKELKHLKELVSIGNEGVNQSIN